MVRPSVVDADLIGRLPLPLAQLYRRAANAKGPLERHLAAFYLWEAALKLLASTALAVYAVRPRHDPALVERLQNLARPSLGHWWEFVHLLVPVLGADGDPGFARVRDLLLGGTRHDLPFVAGLDVAVLEALGKQTSPRATVSLAGLFDRLVSYRNRMIGHGAASQKTATAHERMAQVLTTGLTQLLGRLDVLAGRRLIHVAEVRGTVAGRWLVDRYELKGEAANRLESLELTDAKRVHLNLLPGRVYLAGTDEMADLVGLHPLVWHDFEENETLFLNARRGRERLELLSYSTGRTLDRAELGRAQQELLGRLLQLPVSCADVAAWSERSRTEEQVPVSADEVSPARRLGEFELRSELGRGGMGVVYRAWQPSLGREVALKVLLRSGDSKADARFGREIQALGRVEHPNLVRIFSSGAQDDRWYYAMELVEGANLADVCASLRRAGSRPQTVDTAVWQKTVESVSTEARRKEKEVGPANRVGSEASNTPPTPKDAPTDEAAGAARLAAPTARTYVVQVVDIVRQLAAAVHKLHERGIVHRDVKPGNVLLSVPDGRPVLLDLGLAQLADEGEGRLTKTRQFVGTLRYASPEQVLAAGRVDRRSDIYSLGATLYELLTLQPIYGITEQTPTPELMQWIQYKEVTPPRAFNPDISRDLQAIVLKCLEKSPDRRYPSAAELGVDLGRWKRGETVSARPRSWHYVLRKFLRRHCRAAVLLTLTGLLMLLLYMVAADAELPLPGSGALRHWLDQHSLSLCRPVPSEAVIHQEAGALHQELYDILKDARSVTGWVCRNLKDRKDTHPEVWTHSQTLCALLRSLRAPREDLGQFVLELDLPFTPGFLIEADGVKYGWLLRPPEEDHTLAEPALWTATALAMALSRPGLLQGDTRRRVKQHLDYTQEVLKAYRPLPTGGWNMYPNQKDPADHNPYTTSLALLALLEARQARQPWEGSVARRDALLENTVRWLENAYDETADPPGWHAGVLSSNKCLDGLTLQIYALLLRAEQEANLPISDTMSRNIVKHLEKCARRNMEFENAVGRFHLLFHDHTGKERLGTETPTFLWYPWAVECCVGWLRHAAKTAKPVADQVQVRRALGHLVIDLGKGASAQARSEWTFRASEMLYAMAVVAAP